MPEVEDDEAAGACGCWKEVSRVGEEGGVAGFKAVRFAEPNVCVYSSFPL